MFIISIVTQLFRSTWISNFSFSTQLVNPEKYNGLQLQSASSLSFTFNHNFFFSFMRQKNHCTMHNSWWVVGVVVAISLLAWLNAFHTQKQKRAPKNPLKAFFSLLILCSFYIAALHKGPSNQSTRHNNMKNPDRK